MSDAWPTFRSLKTPYGNKCVANIDSSPPPSDSDIQQIADNMNSLPPTPKPVGGKCSELLDKMQSNIDHLNNSANVTITKPNELDKLLDNGYKLLEKTNGQWLETSKNKDKLILEDQI